MHCPLLRALPSFLRARYPADSRPAWLQLLAFHALGRPAGQSALVLTLAVYPPMVPRDRGLNDDTRALGFFLMKAALLPA